MDRSAKYWSDILSAVVEIEGFVAPLSSLNEYTRDLKTKRAVERGLAIIGEAVGKLIKEDPGVQVEGARAIVGMRNRLIHSYDNIDDKIVWEVVRNHLPQLTAPRYLHE
jgi:uncharacterized protein with HEPN domain